MTQPYGGQPPQQPGGGQYSGGQYPGGGQQQPGGSQNYQQGGGGYPQAPGYQQGYGGMPAAPEERGGGGPVARPGVTTAAAVLAFVQGGITLITSGILLLGLAAIESYNNDASAGGVDIQGGLGEAWAVTIIQLVGVGLLIWGGVKLMSGTAGHLFTIAAGLQIALCIYWLAREAAPFVPVLLIVMPITALVLALGKANKEYAQSRSGRR
ncbi:hypothetical protein [Actinophytocola sediminis]